ncbi:MAG: tetratricopeptide repeat protein [Bacteroidota bacterium]
MKHTLPRLLVVMMAALVFASGCREEGLINKTKYQGEKIKNYCQDFEEEVNALVEANNGVAVLRTSEYDNSQFDYFYLEPGQIEQIGDTLYMRLINDINYDRYLHKRVAVQVFLNYKSMDHLEELEEDPEGELANPLIIDRAYYDANKEPFFVYKFPVGERVDGKQIALNFAILQYKKNGDVKRTFCGTMEAPLGPLDPPCCTHQPWQNTNLQSVVRIPELEIDPEEYRYKGFTGTLDLIFPMNSVKFDRDELSNVILNYIEKYEKEGFEVQSVDMTGYASQGGTVEYNMDLSQARSEAVQEALKKHLEEIEKEGVSVSGRGSGEDWERLELLTKTAVFSDAERQKLMDIINSSMSKDEKEAEFRKLPFWSKFIKEVLVYCRHVFIEFTFKYEPNTMYVDMYPSQMPVISPELYNVATKTMTITKFKKGVDVNEGLNTLNTLIDVNNNRKPNLFAMRSTYHFAQNNVRNAISDIEDALEEDPDNLQYGLAALSYKTKYADSYSLDDRMDMLADYNSFVLKYPNNNDLQFNRVIMMDKVGFISGALAEYEGLMGEEKSAALLNNRGVALMKTNRLLQASSDFEEAVEKDPKLAEAHFNLAVLHAYKGLPEQSITHLEKAVELDPAYKEGLFSNPAFNIIKSNSKFEQKFR